MTRAAIDRTSFAGGEVSKKLWARHDLARHSGAVRRAENFVVLLEGGLTRRSGSRYIADHRDQTEKGKFVPFHYGAGDSYMLAFNDGYIRFFRNGGVVLDGPAYEIAQPYAEADLPNLRWTQVGNILFLACAGYAPRSLTRNDHIDWTLALYDNTNGPLGAQNLDESLTVQASAVTGAGITLTADSARFVATDVGRMIRLDEVNYQDTPQWVENETVAINEERRWEGNVYRAASGGKSGFNPPIHIEGTYHDGQEGDELTISVGWEYLHSGHGFAIITAATGAPSLTATADVVQRIPASVVSNPTESWWWGAWSDYDGWPDLVRLHDGRMFWAKDDFFWLTKGGDFFDFDVTLYEDAGIAGRITATDGQRVNIRWAMAANMLILGTASSEWTLRGANIYEALTIDTVRPKDESYIGSAEHEPARIDEGIVFIGKSKKRLHFAKLDPIGEAIAVEEMSVAARHLFSTSPVAGIVHQRDPNRLLWAWRDDGVVAAATFMPEQEMRGFTRQVFQNGLVEDAAVIPSSDETRSELYLSIKRTIDGATKRYIEILQPFFEPTDEDAPTADGAWFVDSGLSYSGAVTTTLSGLDHLEGETVRLVINGYEVGDFVVDSGAISGWPTVGGGTMEAVVGIPIVAKVRSLDFETDAGAGTSKGRAKQARSVTVQRADSVGGKLTANFGPEEEIDLTGALDYGVAMPLSSDPVQMTLDSPSEVQAQLELICDNALPFTLAGWAPDLDITEA